MSETVSSILKKTIRDLGFRDPKACSRAVGLPYELFRKVAIEKHIPRDGQILNYANRLGLDPARLIRLAHYERAPREAKQYLEVFLANDEDLSQALEAHLSPEEQETLGKALKILRGSDLRAKEALETIVARLAIGGGIQPNDLRA